MDTREFANRMKTVCLHGKVITNPYTGRLVYVPCGICDACMANRATTNEMRVRAQENISKYSYFVTLTYNAKTIPSYKINLVSVGEGSNVYSCVAEPRLSVSRTVTMFANNRRLKRKKVVPVSGLSKKTFEPFTFVATPQYVKEYCSQADLAYSNGSLKYSEYQGTYGYLNWHDVALFMKRLRKSLFKIIGSYEKIHTYIVGEYGPKTFRPHFHLLLFFDSDKVAENIGKSISSCWKLGRVDWSASYGDAERYVAGYCSSFSSLPYHIRESRSIRSRGRFSVGFGNDYFSKYIAQARKGDFTPFIDGVPCTVNGRIKTIYPWRSLIDSVFFRFANRDGSTCFELSRIIFSVCNVFRRPAFRNLTAFGVVRKLYWYLYKHLTPTDRVKFLSEDNPLKDISLYLNLPFPNIPDEDFENSFYSRYYLLFHSVVTFLNFNGISVYEKNNRPFHLWQLLQNSINFYKVRDYESLANTLKDCESFACDSAYILARQTEEENQKFLKSPEGKLSQTLLGQHVWLNTKHRELNDRNIKFVQYGAL